MRHRSTRTTIHPLRTPHTTRRAARSPCLLLIPLTLHTTPRPTRRLQVRSPAAFLYSTVLRCLGAHVPPASHAPSAQYYTSPTYALPSAPSTPLVTNPPVAAPTIHRVHRSFARVSSLSSSDCIYPFIKTRGVRSPIVIRGHAHFAKCTYGNASPSFCGQADRCSRALARPEQQDRWGHRCRQAQGGATEGHPRSPGG